MRRLFFVASLTLLAQIFPAISTSAITPTDKIIGMSLTEGDSLQTSLSHLTDYVPIGSSSSWIWCENLDDPDCSSGSIGVRAFLLPCSELATKACIKEVYAESKDGARINAVFVRTVAANEKYDFKEDLARGIVAGTGTGGLWQFPGLTHGGGTDIYAVQARLEGSSKKEPSAIYDRIEFGLAAVKEVSGDFRRNAIEFKQGTTVDEIRGFDTIGANGRPDYKCVMTEVGKCFERATFPAEYRFGMTVLLPNQLSGWFHGRISTPEIITTSVGTHFEYSVEANPVKVPYIREEVRPSSWGQALVDYVNSNFICNPDCSETGGGFMMPGNSGEFAFDLTGLFLPVIKDKATGTGDFWSVRTLDQRLQGQDSQIIQSCSKDAGSVSGIVTTNSMVYSAGPPSYNAEAGSLDYRVLSPHFNEKNEENIGSYDLLLDSKVARCIYKFSNAPIKAEIEILGSDGASKVATTVIGEKNGWLFMSANGFTYSEPTVRIKLSQDPPAPEPTPTPTPSPTTPESSGNQGSTIVSAGKKKVSITCLKGAKSKKVTATKPKCPKGYKKA